jgi:ribonucleoside-diphosphate reductase alpha chain
MTDDPDFRIASSILDYVFRVLALEYLPESDRHALNIKTAAERKEEADEKQASIEGKLEDAPVENGNGNGHTNGNGNGNAKKDEGVIVLGPVATAMSDSLPFCGQCGVAMNPAGSCFACPSCGSTSGCS